MFRVRVRWLCLLAAFATSVLPAAARAGGTVAAWGENGAGQLGIDSFSVNASTNVPVGVCPTGASSPCQYGPFLENAMAISAGGSSGGAALTGGNSEHNLALLSDGTVVAWGENVTGEVGDGTGSPKDVPAHVCAVGWVGPCPSGPYLNNVTAVSANQEESLALLSNGTVVSWGDNFYDELGIGTNVGPEACGTHSCSLTPVEVIGLEGVKAISAGNRFSLALLENGTVMAWGDDYSGELGNGTWGTISGAPTPVSGLSGVKEISAGTGGLALLGSGQVMSWGQNVYGALGDGLNSTSLPEVCHGEPCSTTPVPVCAVGSAGPCPGGPFLTDVAAVAAGKGLQGTQNLALLDNGTVVDWGFNRDGQLGVGEATGPESCYVYGEPCSATPVQVCAVGAIASCPTGPYLSEVAAVSSGGEHGTALVSSGMVATWGWNGFEQLGDGTSSGPELCGPEEPCKTAPVLVCAVRATAFCPTGPYLTGATAISAGGLNNLTLAPLPIVPGPYWYKKNVMLTKGGPHVAATTSGTLTFALGKTAVKCKMTDGEEIWNPTGITPGEDAVTSFVAACKSKPSPCPTPKLVEIVAQGLPWPSHLLSASPVRDEIENVKLEVRCSGSFLDEFEGTMTPEVGNGVLVFGLDTLKDSKGHLLGVGGKDKLKAPPGKVTAH